MPIYSTAGGSLIGEISAEASALWSRWRRAKPAASSASVAILGSATFDVFDIDDTSLPFDGLKVRVRAKKGPLCKVEDVSGDLFPDLVCQVETVLFMIEPGQGTAELRGETFDGIAIVGEDSIEIVP